jgi:hypothetical protein
MVARKPFLVDARVAGRSETDATATFRRSQSVANDLEHAKRRLFVMIPTTSISGTFVPPRGVYSESGGFWDVPAREPEWLDIRDALATAWASLEQEGRRFADGGERLTRATRPTSTTVSSVATLLRRRYRDERLRRMPPEARAKYDRIRKLREQIGPIDFDLVKALRELRDND